MATGGITRKGLIDLVFFKVPSFDTISLLLLCLLFMSIGHKGTIVRGQFPKCVKNTGIFSI